MSKTRFPFLVYTRNLKVYCENDSIRDMIGVVILMVFHDKRSNLSVEGYNKFFGSSFGVL